jgi:poly(A) polymerase
MNPEWMSWPETETLIKAFAVQKSEFRFVGGAVRDALLKRQVTDVDAATPLVPEKVMKLLKKAGINAIPTGIDHGTVTAVIGKKHFEITTLRKDVSTDGRHAQVEYTDDWKADAARRDFTMNAMYFSPAGELFDYFGGEKDAEAGIVKFIGDPSARIQEDYLRILRFFRFFAWYGKGEADKEALAACKALAPEIASLSGERIQQEMLKLLAAPQPSAALELMHPEVLRHTFGFAVHHFKEIAELEKIEHSLSLPPDPLVRLALLLPSIASLEHVTSKWKLSGEMDKRLSLWLEHMGQLQADMELADQKRLLRKIGADMFKTLVLIRWAQKPEAREAFLGMYMFADQWVLPIFGVTGNDLKALGILEGKELGEILTELEDMWEASDYNLSKNDLLAKVRR